MLKPITKFLGVLERWPKGANSEAVGAKFGVLTQFKEKYVDDAEAYCKSIKVASRKRILRSKI